MIQTVIKWHKSNIVSQKTYLQKTHKTCHLTGVYVHNTDVYDLQALYKYVYYYYFYYYFSPWYFIPRVLKLAKVKMYARNGYYGDSETVNVI